MALLIAGGRCRYIRGQRPRGEATPGRLPSSIYSQNVSTGKMILAAAEGGDIEAATKQLELALMMDGAWM